MNNLQIDKATAKRIYKTSPKWFQEILISTFGAECFSENITDRIKTIEDASEETGISIDDLNKAIGTPDEINYKKVKMVAKARNEGWSPDWGNGNEKKWFPIFKMPSPSSGFGFDDSDCSYAVTYSTVGSRLCFKNEALSNYAAKQFIDLYKSFLV